MLEQVMNILSSNSGAYALALVSTIASYGLANLWDETVAHARSGRTQR